MTETKLYRPARDGLIVPMPDRGNMAMPAEGAAIDLSKPYYRRLLADGDIVPVADADRAAEPETEKPAPATAKRKSNGKD